MIKKYYMSGILLSFMDSINSSCVDHLEVKLIWVSKSCFFLQSLFSENTDENREGRHIPYVEVELPD